MVDTYSRCGLAGNGSNAARANREDFRSSVANSGLDPEFFGSNRRNPLVCHVLDWLTHAMLIVLVPRPTSNLKTWVGRLCRTTLRDVIPRDEERLATTFAGSAIGVQLHFEKRQHFPIASIIYRRSTNG